MRNKFLLFFYGIVTILSSIFVTLTTYYIYEINFQKIVGSLIVFCYKDSFYLSSIKNLYFLGIVVGLVLGIILILSYHILSKIGVINYLIIYLKNIKNKFSKFLFLLVLSIFGYIYYMSLYTINIIRQSVIESSSYIILIITLLVCIIILLLLTPILFRLEKKAFKNQQA